MSSNRFHQQADKEAIIEVKKGERWEYKPKGLDITWGKRIHYWKINDEAAELLQVNWLEVNGTLDNLELNKEYKISFEISVEPHSFGWEGIRIYVMAKVGKKGAYHRKTFSLGKENYSEKIIKPSPEDSLEVSTNNPDDRKLYFGLYEVSSGVWKGGLKIYKAIVEKV